MVAYVAMVSATCSSRDAGDANDRVERAGSDVPRPLSDPYVLIARRPVDMCSCGRTDLRISGQADRRIYGLRKSGGGGMKLVGGNEVAAVVHRIGAPFPLV